MEKELVTIEADFSMGVEKNNHKVKKTKVALSASEKAIAGGKQLLPNVVNLFMAQTGSK